MALQDRVAAFAALLANTRSSKPAAGATGDNQLGDDVIAIRNALAALGPEIDGVYGRPILTPRGAWAASTAYAVGDLFTADGSVFRVTTAHTSGTTAPTTTAPGTNAVVWVAKGAQGTPGTGQITEITQVGYDALSAAQKAAAYYAIVPDGNLLADTQALLNTGNLDRFATRGSGGTLSAATIGGVGAVRLTAGSSPSRDLGVATIASVTPGKKYAMSGLLRHEASWGPVMRLDIIWRTSADAAILTVAGAAVTLPAVGSDVTLSVPDTGAAPSNAASAELRFRGAHATDTPAPNGAVSIRNLSAVAL